MSNFTGNFVFLSHFSPSSIVTTVLLSHDPFDEYHRKSEMLLDRLLFFSAADDDRLLQPLPRQPQQTCSSARGPRCPHEDIICQHDNNRFGGVESSSSWNANSPFVQSDHHDEHRPPQTTTMAAVPKRTCCYSSNNSKNGLEKVVVVARRRRRTVGPHNNTKVVLHSARTTKPQPAAIEQQQQRMTLLRKLLDSKLPRLPTPLSPVVRRVLG
jgi:hypothetical protein